MDAFSGGFVVGVVITLVLGAATLGVCLWAATTDAGDDWP
jgi:hypothetical protein